MMDSCGCRMPQPEAEKLFSAEVILKDAWPLGEIGTGYSEIVAVAGGRVEGRINGKIMDFGGDWGLLHSEAVNVIDTRFLVSTEDGEFIAVSSRGKMIMDRETMQRGCSGELIDPSEYYFRTYIDFTAGAEQYRWLNDILAFAVVMMTAEGNILMDVYEIK